MSLVLAAQHLLSIEGGRVGRGGGGRGEGGRVGRGEGEETPTALN